LSTFFRLTSLALSLAYLNDFAFFPAAIVGLANAAFLLVSRGTESKPEAGS
jgi:hypothetical protein